MCLCVCVSECMCVCVWMCVCVCACACVYSIRQKKGYTNFLTFSTILLEVQTHVIQDAKYVRELVDMRSILAKYVRAN